MLKWKYSSDFNDFIVAASNVVAYDMIYFEFIKKEALCYEFSCHVAISSRLIASKQCAHKPSTALLVVTEEDLDGQPGVTADLEAVGAAAELLHLIVGQ